MIRHTTLREVFCKEVENEAELLWVYDLTVLPQVLPFEKIKHLFRALRLQQAETEILCHLFSIIQFLFLVLELLEHGICTRTVHLILFLGARLSEHILELFCSLLIIIIVCGEPSEHGESCANAFWDNLGPAQQEGSLAQESFHFYMAE